MKDEMRRRDNGLDALAARMMQPEDELQLHRQFLETGPDNIAVLRHVHPKLCDACRC